MKINKYFKKRNKVLNVRSSTPSLQEIKNIKSDVLKLELEIVELRQSITNLNYKKADKDAFTTKKEDKIQEQNGET